jgi:DNA-directed RNA polymerase III subunit RPC6
MSDDQELVYALVDEAGSDGIWTKQIKMKTGLHDANFRKAVKELESKGMIQDMKSVEHPNRKMYIKANLRPSERATGGPWYTNGELDLPFIEVVTQICENFILKKSFYASRLPGSGAAAKKMREPKKSKSKMTAEEVKALRDKELGPRVEPQTEMEKRKAEYDRMLPMPAGYNGYATCDEITRFLDEKQVAKTILTAVDVQQLLDIMVYDEKIERVRCGGDLWGYRTLRQSLRHGDIASQNLLTEAPCGKCPVFDLCEEGGPVGPSNCEYFNDWLSL